MNKKGKHPPDRPPRFTTPAPEAASERVSPFQVLFYKILMSNCKISNFMRVTRVLNDVLL